MLKFAALLALVLTFRTVEPSGVPQQIHLSYGDSASKTIIVTWSTYDEVQQSRVEFGICANAGCSSTTPLTDSVQAEVKKFVDGGIGQKVQYIHRAHLSNLQPQQKYAYRCIGSGGSSEVLHFPTAGGSDWAPRIAVFGDLGLVNLASVPAITSEVKAGLYDAVVGVGDYAYDFASDNATLGDNFMNALQPFASLVPLMLCPGNHEDAYNFSHFINRFSMPNYKHTDNMYYSFDLGPIHFVSISTEYYFYPSLYNTEHVKRQYDWIAQDLANANSDVNRSERPFIIVLQHRPFYCTEASERARDRRAMEPPSIDTNLKSSDDVPVDFGGPEKNSSVKKAKATDGQASKREVKVPKGTRDFDPLQMAIREKAFGIVTSVFKRHGGVALDTPVFELKETLMGKYGEDSKLIYDLADQGGELLSLRYDLTVPFARYLASRNIQNMRRYHIAKVYRRDNPARGRYREFYQCDFDIAGKYETMVADFEVLKLLTEILDRLDIGDYQVKLNHRRLLDGMLEICGVPAEKFRAICSSIDKLDKLAWKDVYKEMVNDKGLPEEVAEKIGKLVSKRGKPLELLAELNKEDSPFHGNSASEEALGELNELFTYMDIGKCMNRFVFDLSLARGLDYYTGVIFEAVFVGTVKMGSIAAGGRYDDLVGMFSGRQVPAVGMSLGIERVFAIMEELEQAKKISVRKTETQVLVLGIGKSLWNTIIGIATELWDLNIATEFKCVGVGRIAKSLSDASEKEGIPWVVLVGQDELDKGIVRLKDMAAKQEEEVTRSDIAASLSARIKNSQCT